jgi:uncharacterized protein (DUF1330 family)
MTRPFDLILLWDSDRWIGRRAARAVNLTGNTKGHRSLPTPVRSPVGNSTTQRTDALPIRRYLVMLELPGALHMAISGQILSKRKNPMPAYIIALVEVLDEEKFREYQAAFSETFGAHGGRFLTRGTGHTMLEGAEESRTCVLAEFPSIEKATEFWNSPEYRAAIHLREGAVKMQAFLFDGAA